MHPKGTSGTFCDKLFKTQLQPSFLGYLAKWPTQSMQLSCGIIIGLSCKDPYDMLHVMLAENAHNFKMGKVQCRHD